MIDAIIGIAIFIGSIAAAFFAGKRRKSQEYQIDGHNEYIATRARIEAATRPHVSDADTDDSLRRHDKR
jgi:hypothetical protein